MVAKITKYWRISRLLAEYPTAVEILLENDIPCAGCNGASTERLNEGLASHGLSEEEIDAIVTQINQELAKEEAKQAKENLNNIEKLKFHEIEGYSQLENGLKISSAAIAAFLKYQTAEDTLSIKLEAGGCSGYNYKYEFSKEAGAKQVKFQITPELYVYLDAFTIESSNKLIIDYKESLQFTGFVFENEKAKQKCSCGKSMGF